MKNRLRWKRVVLLVLAVTGGGASWMASRFHTGSGFTICVAITAVLWLLVLVDTVSTLRDIPPRRR